jgi:ABC-type transport system, involved in lipoprotein release, permease component
MPCSGFNLAPKPWALTVARRWFAARRESGGSASSFLAAIGIGIGVAALIVVLGVMNGFQMGFIDSILKVSSFHVRVQGAAGDEAAGGETLAAELGALPGVRSVVPFAETRCLLASDDGRTFPLLLRALPLDAEARDPEMMQALGIQSADGRWKPGKGIVIGAELARYLRISEGAEAELLIVSAGGEEGVEAKPVRMRIDGTFRSGYYDFDFGMAIASIPAAAKAFPADKPENLVYGVKLKDRYADAAFISRLEAALGLSGDRIEGWRDYNRVFFGALRMEKSVMMLLVGLIFLVVGVNIFHGMRRAVAERSEDIAVLRAMGASSEEIEGVFVIDGLAIGSGGALAGLALGLAIAINVNQVFALVEGIVNGASFILSRIAGGFGGGDFKVFSPQYFYLMEVPVRVLFPETLLIVAAAIACAAVAALAASRRVADLAPAEVLHYE